MVMDVIYIFPFGRLGSAQLLSVHNSRVESIESRAVRALDRIYFRFLLQSAEDSVRFTCGEP